MRAPQPMRLPRSWQSVRTYVPLLHERANLPFGLFHDRSSKRETLMKRGSRATSCPWRASLYRGIPPIFLAENIGGVWYWSPIKRAMCSRRESSVSPSGTGDSATTSPSESCESVSTPSSNSPS